MLDSLITALGTSSVTNLPQRSVYRWPMAYGHRILLAIIRNACRFTSHVSELSGQPANQNFDLL